MAGQANVTIGAKTWSVYVADQPAELTAGLSGWASIPADTGMLFDVGYDRLIQVTTVPMLFNIDVVFIDSDLKVVEIHSNVEPGNIFTSTEEARYFLEVNENEAADVSVGDNVGIVLTTLALPFSPVQEDWAASIGSFMTTFIPFVFFLAMMRWGVDWISKLFNK